MGTKTTKRLTKKPAPKVASETPAVLTFAQHVAALPACAPDMTRLARVTFATSTCSGALIDCVSMATPWSNGYPRPVLVLRVAGTAEGERDGERVKVAGGEMLHVDAPELAMLQVLSTDAERVHAVTLHRLPGLHRWAADVSKETIPRT